ncbi:MAG: phosphate uptake regulator PhoU [Conexivisphaerales archaeon]
MTRLIDIGLERISQMVLLMAEIAQKTVDTSVEAYLRGKEQMEKVDAWSHELRNLQEEIAELALEVIARYQPVASDLRYVRACMEIAYGFSRFGRYAYDIAQVLHIWPDLTGCNKNEIESMARIVSQMIRTSVKAFADRDARLGVEAFRMDDEVDAIMKQALERIASNLSPDARCDVPQLLVMRYLERIADHAAYIGEAVSYVVTGTPTPRL